MKKVALLLLVFFFAGCLKKEENKIDLGVRIYLTKTDQGFNIYSGVGELIHKYNKQNCDSLSLKTLDDIYTMAKEY